MCTVHRNRTLLRRYIRNVYCAQKQNSSQTVHHKCVLCTETESFPDGTSEMCTVHRNRILPDGTSEMCTVHKNRTLSRRYITNVCCAKKQHFSGYTSEMCTVYRSRTFSSWCIRNVYCAQKQNTFQTVHHNFILCTETEHFPDGTSEICTVHRNNFF